MTSKRRVQLPVAALLGLATLALLATWGPSPAVAKNAKHHRRKPSKSFHRIATFPVFRNTDIDTETVAEIVAATEDGKTLLYTDSGGENLGFVDISDPEDPQPGGIVELDGEPTSVAVVGDYALVCIDTSADFIDTSGKMEVVHIASQTVVRSIDLGGQPDSIAASPDGAYAAIAIENERDEDLGDGAPTQLPAGFVVVVNTSGDVGDWSAKSVALTGIADLYPTDPEPEYVSINSRNVAAVTLQENNYCVLIDLATCEVVGDFSFGAVSLDKIDTEEEGRITPDSMLANVPREPDAVTWITDKTLATANEGDLDGGSRGFTIWTANGKVLFDSDNELEHLTMRIGHYPEHRSENKGSEPEGIAYGRYGKDDLLFVGAERANVVAVYDVDRLRRPRLLQVLPSTVGPEGLLPIPGRNLFVVASEVDDRGDKIRSSITIYRRSKARPAYPTVESVNTGPAECRVPIAWGALSTLAAHPWFPWVAYTAHDSVYNEARIYTLLVGGKNSPAIIYKETPLKDAEGNTVDIDIEGLAVSANGGFWVASEGAGSVDDDSRPVTSKSVLYRVTRSGQITETVELPASVNALQRRFGFEGVASVGCGKHEELYVAFQREWVDDPSGFVRIGRYVPATGAWTFFYYPLDAATSPAGGWVGLSEIIHIRGDRFAVVERDNQGGPDARLKRIYEFSVKGVPPVAQGGTFPVLEKTLARDLVPDLEKDGGFVLEKVEGLTKLAGGRVLIVTDNDGVDDASGETQLIDLGRIFGK